MEALQKDLGKLQAGQTWLVRTIGALLIAAVGYALLGIHVTALH